MVPGGEFERILAAKLGPAPVSGPPLAGVWSASWRFDPAVIFRPSHTWPAGSPSPRRGAAAWGAGSDCPGVRPQWAASQRIARPKTVGQRAALERLNQLGAGGLDAFSSDPEIRSAYRTLVRRYHPDRHPGAGPSERIDLARQFAEVTEAYHLLIGRTVPAFQ